MSRRLAVLVIDSQPIIRYAVREFLTNRPYVGLVMEADSVGQALAMMADHSPDVIVTELVFPDVDGMDAVWALIRDVRAGVVAFCEHDAWDFVEDFLDHGGMGFVSKRSPVSELASAVRAVADRRKWIAPSLRSVARTETAPNGANGCLTAREREVVTLIAGGFTSKQIADQLCVSLKTVETHRYRVFKKLKIRRIAQLADYAMRHGLSPGGSRVS